LISTWWRLDFRVCHFRAMDFAEQLVLPALSFRNPPRIVTRNDAGATIEDDCYILDGGPFRQEF